MIKLRSVFFLVLILTIFLVTAIVWSISTQNSQVNNNSPTNETAIGKASIASISPNESWINPAGTTMAFWFRVNVRNDDSKALENLTLNLTIANVSSNLYEWGMTEPLGTVQPDGSSVAEVYILAPLNKLNDVSGNTVTIQLVLDGKVVDEDSLILPKWG